MRRYRKQQTADESPSTQRPTSREPWRGLALCAALVLLLVDGCGTGLDERPLGVDGGKAAPTNPARTLPRSSHRRDVTGDAHAEPGTDAGADATSPDAAQSAPAPDGTTVPIHRFYYLKSGDHLLTVDADEGLQAGYTYEGVAFDVFTAPATNRHPIYRCYVSTVGDHFVSEDPDCESTTVEGLFGFVASAPTDAVARPIVRCHHPSIADHLTTTDEAECRIHGYLVEAVLGYVK